MSLIHTPGQFASFDGAKLFYRAWVPEGTTPPAGIRRGVVLFHRGHEHSGRWEETVQHLAANGLEDVSFFAWDQRGHGQSPGDRGDAESVAAVARDAEWFARHLTRAHGVPVEELVVLAHSVGAVVATAWIHDYAPPVRGMVLVAPALRVKLYVPLAIPALRFKQRALGPGYVKSYVKARMLTHDPAEAAAYQSDKAIFRQISVRMLLDLHDTGTRLLADAAAITAPVLILGAGSDWVVQNGAQRTFFERLSSPIKQFEILPGFYHGMFHEKERESLLNRITPFMQDCFARPHERGVLADADRAGYTRSEYDRLRKPAGAAAILWSMQKAFLKTFGSLSRGIRLGRKTGFDSGVMLDYVYENKAHGTTPLGTLIDRQYLNAIGWRGIRVRREHLERLLVETIRRVHDEGRPVRILDIAAGAGRYVLETMKQIRDIPISAHLRDYQQINLDAAKFLAEKLLLKSVTLERGDAFDELSLAAVTPKPTIGIVSGLYELFPENAPLRRSLAELARAIDPGGYLLYTCQPWHPQVEMIARTLTNREGQPWIMRRRTQAEMDELVRQAGFEKVDQAIDRWGIFTVSVARRRADAPGS
jgi:alpha-beta hydrolase superfamily lysophospholipase/SAM-dependent methyltransferase